MLWKKLILEEVKREETILKDCNLPVVQFEPDRPGADQVLPLREVARRSIVRYRQKKLRK